MTYETMAHFAQTWGMLYFMAIFAGVLAYAFWPGSGKKFKEAAELPFEEELD